MALNDAEKVVFDGGVWTTRVASSFNHSRHPPFLHLHRPGLHRRDFGYRLCLLRIKPHKKRIWHLPSQSKGREADQHQNQKKRKKSFHNTLPFLSTASAIEENSASGLHQQQKTKRHRGESYCSLEATMSPSQSLSRPCQRYGE